MKTPTPACPECGGHSLYQTTTTSGGGHGLILLPKLGSFLRYPEFQVVVCADCGLTRLYADTESRTMLRTSKRWNPL